MKPHFFPMLAFVLIFLSCEQNVDEFKVNGMAPKLSYYQIFKGNPSDLVPVPDYKLYQLPSGLFTDYAEKQRLVKVPAGTRTALTHDGVPDFPEGTILVKTFFYYKDERDTSKGKNVVETRLLIKSEGAWKVGTYKWNEGKTDAYLITSGFEQTVNWIDGDGQPKIVSYHIPNNAECRACHISGNEVIPIGPKIRNLNIEIETGGTRRNQLEHFFLEGVLDAANPDMFSSLPDYKDHTVSLEKRGRAYLDMNCAHCHSDHGFASGNSLRLAYEKSLNSSKIPDFKDNILSRFERSNMPKTGTTVLDIEGLELLKNYLNSL